MSAFFLALVGLAVFETRLSFLDSVDDDAVSFFLSFVVVVVVGHFICFL